MKNRIAFPIFTALLFCSFAATAQFTIGIQGSYHTASDLDRKDQIGKGLQAKYFFRNTHLAVGAGMRHWVKNYEKTTVNEHDIRTLDISTSFAAFAEWYFGNKKLRPYVGTDIGVYASNINIEVKEKAFAMNAENKRTNFGVAPKAGLLFNTGVVSPFIQAQYNFLFSGGNNKGQAEISNSKASFASFDIGILFRFPKCGCKEKKS